MGIQKEIIMQLVEEEKQKGRRIGEVLETLGIRRPTYYRWKEKEKAPDTDVPLIRTFPLTPDEEGQIDELKEEHPEYRHRRIQGVLQGRGTYISASAIYAYLKEMGKVEEYARRAAPWKEPRYEIWQRNLLWGCDWTKFSIGHIRWYLLTLIDFFSRLIIAFDIIPTVNASHVKEIYRQGLKAQEIPLGTVRKPELRVDRGSPNTSWVTKEFFKIIGAELSFARVRRPTDNAVTERFYGSIKQEEIYLVGNYPDEISAREEVGRYIDFYNKERPHQSLNNYTPEYVHNLNNKSSLLEELTELKRKAREKRKQYWINQKK